MLKKIKYLLDNLSDLDDEKQDSLIFSRRKFLFTFPALIVAPYVFKPVEPIVSAVFTADYVSASGDTTTWVLSMSPGEFQWIWKDGLLVYDREAAIKEIRTAIKEGKDKEWTEL